MPRTTVMWTFAILLGWAMGGEAIAEKIAYPESNRVEVVEDYHGTAVPDPYRWLEEDARGSETVARWVEAQNAVTFAHLAAIPEREAIRQRLTELWNHERYSSPFKAGGRYFYSKNDGLQRQSVIYAVDPGGEERVVLDPNGWSADGTVALAGISPSDDGRFLAYAKSSAGSDWSVWHVQDLNTGEDLPDRLEWTKFTVAAWTVDGKGFFYGRFEPPAPGAEYRALNKNMKVYYHRVGTPQTQDVLVYARRDEPDWGFGIRTTDDGRYLLLAVSKGTDPKGPVLYRDLLEPYAMPQELIGGFTHQYSFIGNDGATFYFLTDLDAPRKRVIAVDTRRPEPGNWKEIVPQADETLRSVSLTANMLVASYLKDAVGYVRMFRLDGSHVRDVAFPGLGSISGFRGKPTETETFYTYTSIDVPPSIYRYDMITGKSELWRRAEVAADTDGYVVKQIFYRSKDGTRVPIFVAHRKGLTLDGNRPTLLYGYGGFNSALTPAFSVSRLAWMELGGVFAMANLRGGGEYGEEWHRAGTKLQKQNTFDDFIAAAEFLIAEKYTRPSRLAIQGGSNGGLLVGAVMTQRPDLFGAALPAVGVMDMLRFHKFTAGRYWVDDYGSSDDPAEFRALYGYSPYHNIKAGVRYPATLITTADTDDRVVPGHSFKFAAALQRAQAGEAPVLIRIETRAGHGAGKPTDKRIEEAADQWAFLVRSLNVKIPRLTNERKAPRR